MKEDVGKKERKGQGSGNRCVYDSVRLCTGECAYLDDYVLMSMMTNYLNVQMRPVGMRKVEILRLELEMTVNFFLFRKITVFLECYRMVSHVGSILLRSSNLVLEFVVLEFFITEIFYVDGCCYDTSEIDHNNLLKLSTKHRHITKISISYLCIHMCSDSKLLSDPFYSF